jgi:hypothetical protein
MIWGTIAPTSLHVAQILHTIRHSLNTGTCRHTRRHGGRGSLHPGLLHHQRDRDTERAGREARAQGKADQPVAAPLQRDDHTVLA